MIIYIAISLILVGFIALAIYNFRHGQSFALGLNSVTIFVLAKALLTRNMIAAVGFIEFFSYALVGTVGAITIFLAIAVIVAYVQNRKAKKA